MKTALKRFCCALALWVTLLANSALADAGQVTRVLHEFLAGVSDGRADVHEWFWADDLVYTSAAGERFGKDEVLAGSRQATAEPAPAYSAEDIDVRVHGDFAVVTFRLVASAGSAGRTEYYNTGILLLRDGAWQAVTWHATRRASAGQQPDD
jgi:ketosteroid isomerase-like protein